MVGVRGLLTTRRISLAFVVLLIAAGLAGRLAAAAESGGPSASFTYDPGSPLSGDSISFTSTSSDDGTIVAEAWEFDDGEVGNGAQVNHTYGIPGVYTVKLTVTDDEGLQATDQQNVTVGNRSPTAAFHFSPAEPAINESIELVSDSSDPEGRIDVQRWDLNGDGDFSDATGSTNSVSFSSPGPHAVSLLVEDRDGGTDTISQTIEVVDPPNQSPTANFNFSPSDPMVLDNVTFTSTAKDSDGSIALEEWSLDGDANFETSGHQVQKVFLFAGDHTVRLRVTDNEGAVDEISKIVTVTSVPNDPPTADFSVSPSSPKTLENVTFESTSSDADGTIVSYGWELDGDNDFDDRLGSSFSQSFSPAGTYTIALKVIDDDGESAVKTKNVVIANQAPTADFEFSPASPQKNEPVTFTSLASDPENRIEKLEWDLDGDNQYDDAAGPNAQKTFDSPGNKTVRLRVTDLEGASHTATKTVTIASQPPTAAFTFSPESPLSHQPVIFTSTSTDPDGTIADTKWDLDNDGSFDDGTALEAEKTFTTSGNKTVRLQVRDDDGNTVSTSRVVSVGNRPPTAKIEAPSAALKNTDVTFKSTSSDLDGSISRTEWDTDGDGFDDGSGATKTMRYSSAGLKTVRLRVADNLGLTDEATHVVDIGGNTAPTAAFTASTLTPLSGAPVTFTSTSSDPDGSIEAVAWDLDGDGNFDDSTKTSVTTQFPSPGLRIVRLQVTDNDGAKSVTQKNVTVGNRAPTAVILSQPASPRALDLIDLTVTASDQDGTVVSHLWDLDNDGAFDDASGITARHAFPTKGVYTVKVRVTDNSVPSASGTASIVLNVANRPPLASFTYTPAAPNPFEPVRLSSTSTDLDGSISKIEWDTDNDGAFDDGTGLTALKTFQTAGNKPVGIRVIDNDGGEATWSQTIVVGNRPPVASFDFRPAAPVADQLVTFFSTADDPDKNIASVEWDLDGDGGFEASGSTAGRQYPAGSFNVSMRVTDTSGAFAIVTQTIVVGTPPPPPRTDNRLRALSPFPLVRMAGRIGKNGTRFRVLTVDAPTGSTVTVRCKGRGCPFGKSTRAARAGERLAYAARKVRIRKLERRLLRPGVLIKIYVTRAGSIGKYTSIKIRRAKPPKRLDRCLMPGNTKPVQCPS